MGDRDKIRPLWRHYFQNTRAIIFVVDSNDSERVSEAREELQRLMNEAELRNALLLVFANKQDLPGAMTAAELTNRLGLNGLEQVWYVQDGSATAQTASMRVFSGSSIRCRSSIRSWTSVVEGGALLYDLESHCLVN